ncbi:MAG: MFS transporter [Chloroflexia bacterium]
MAEVEESNPAAVENATEDAVQQATEAPPESLSPLWRNRDYMLLWSGQVVSTLGSTASGIVFPLLILAITGSAAAAGIAGALQSIPYLIFSLPAGALIDRWNRKRVMILCDVGRAINMGSIAVALALGTLTTWQIYVVAFIEGTLFVFFNIAEVAALPRVVPKAQLPSATGQNQAAFAVAGIVGPSLGTFLFQVVGRAAPFIADAVSYVASVISLFFIKAEFQLERAVTRAPRHLGREIMEGLRWLWSQPLVRFMAFLTGGANFIGSASFLILIVFAKENLGAPEASIGIIFSIGSIGAIVGSIIGGQIQKRFSFGQVIISVMWLDAILLPLYAFAPNVWVLGAISVPIFLSGPVYNVVQFSYRVALIPDELQGRVNSSFRLLAFGFQPLGTFLAGVLIENYGAVPALAFFSAWQFLLAIVATLNGHVRNARPVEQAQAA